MKRGKFITFEGGDGVGKSTQIQALAARLRQQKIGCVVTREPGGTAFAERIRDLILGGSLPEHPPLAEALLFAAARVDHVERLIRPSLATGAWVLCDRFADSTRAYQGAAGGACQTHLLQLEQLTHVGCTPDLTLILDLDPIVGSARIAGRNSLATAKQTHALDEPDIDDPFEGRGLSFQQRLREAFLAISTAEPNRCALIDAGRTGHDVGDEIWDIVQDRLFPEAP